MAELRECEQMVLQWGKLNQVQFDAPKSAFAIIFSLSRKLGRYRPPDRIECSEIAFEGKTKGRSSLAQYEVLRQGRNDPPVQKTRYLSLRIKLGIILPCIGLTPEASFP